MSPHRAALVALVVPIGCVSEERAARDTSTDTTDPAEVTAQPCTSPGVRECLAVDAARVCQGGVWVTTACPEGHSCARATGECTRGSLSCFGTLVCSIDCANDDAPCRQACSDAATVPAVDALGALNACQCQDDCWPILCGRVFPWPTYSEISACVAEACAPEAAACVGGGATGAAPCATVRDCLLACAGDVFCAEGCFPAGAAEAQTIAAFYYVCVRAKCGPDPSPTCLFSAQADRCAALWAACQDDDGDDGGDR